MAKLIIFSAIFGYFYTFSYSQNVAPNPTQWHFPNGNPEGTRYQPTPSALIQDISKFEIKWFNRDIYGDVQPLIGNIVPDGKIDSTFFYDPLEIVAVMGGKLVVVNSLGKSHKANNFPISFLNRASVLFDTNSTQLVSLTSNPLTIGIETVEFESIYDTIGYSYLMGYDIISDTVSTLKRLAFNLRDFKPNYFSSVKPVWGKGTGPDYRVFGIVNMSKPGIDTTGTVIPPFFRGMADFDSKNLRFNYPMPDMGDIKSNRLFLGPEIIKRQPSMSMIGSNTIMLLPVFPSMSPDIDISNPIMNSTNTKKPYLINVNLTTNNIQRDFHPIDLSALVDSAGNKRPLIQPYFVELYDNGRLDKYILVSEEYLGLDSSIGTPRLHLFTTQGIQLTKQGDTLLPSVIGYKNHGWSVSTGNVDGNDTNRWDPYYPNNTGKELVITHSTRDLAVAGNRLMVIRLNSGPKIEKVSPPDSYLFRFDTIATQKISGWVAVVNDIDRGDDGKDEIFLVDGSILRILKLRNYTDIRYRLGMPFDTLAEWNFPQETISSVEVADLEGDGKNDLIVTTYQNTYVIGEPLPGRITLIYPTITQSFCPGDTVELRWLNRAKFPQGLKIYFREYIGGNPTKDTILIKDVLNIDKDTTVFQFQYNSRLTGKTGRIIVEANNTKVNISDSTTLITFIKPDSYPDTNWAVTYRISDNIRLFGTVDCIDSLKVQFSDDSTWIDWLRPIVAAGSFDDEAEIPCINIFRIDKPDTDSMLNFRFIHYSRYSTDTGRTYKVKIRPNPFDIGIDSNSTVCPTRILSWDISSMIINCDKMHFLFKSGDTSWILIDTITDSKYNWNVPTNLPGDSIMIRLSCDNPCQRTDTILVNYKPRFINIISPNPFNPVLGEVAEICYTVPEKCFVTLKIFDEANRIVRIYPEQEEKQPYTAYCAKWDGTTYNGSIAAMGTYYVLLELSTGIHDVYPIFLKK